MRAITIAFAGVLAVLAVLTATPASAETNYDAPVIVIPDMPAAPQVEMPDYPNLPGDTELLDQLVSSTQDVELSSPQDVELSSPQAATKPRKGDKSGKDAKPAKTRSVDSKAAPEQETEGTTPSRRPGQVRSPEELLAILQAANADTATPEEQAELVPPQSAAKAESGLPLGTLAAVGGGALLVWYAAAVLRRRREVIAESRAQAS